MNVAEQINNAMIPGNAVNDAVIIADSAFQKFKSTTSEERISFFNTLIQELEKEKSIIINAAHLETNLPPARLENEFNRTLTQIRLFSTVIKEDHWKEISIDVKKDENNIVVSDLRKINVALGPVAVFGASNFPLAFSVAGGDTISAFAAGCPVIVKAHNGHIATGKLVAEAILAAGKKSNLPKGFFSIIFDEGYSAGIALVKHPLIKAVGFTGSYQGGKVLIDAVNSRKEPVPVFAEMGSLNPVILLPDELKSQNLKWAKIFAGSITAGCGQFCTKPGLFFAIENEALDCYIQQLKIELSEINVHPMLNPQIKNGFINKLENHIIKAEQVTYFVMAKETADRESIHTSIAVVSGEHFISNGNLQEEFFGPFALIIKCKDKAELEKAVSSLNGQLTSTIIGKSSELNSFSEIIEILKNKSGRILFNAIPTGVEVCHSINHGGPFPASSSVQFTSVGADAIKRFVRPLCFQTWPHDELPDELKNENPKNCLRRINGKLTTDRIID